MDAKEVETIILVNIKADNYPWYVEMGKIIHLPFHPNLLDTIEIDELYCQIVNIKYDYDSKKLWLRAIIEEGFSEIRDENSEKVIKSLLEVVNELKECDWYTNDYDLSDTRIANKC